MGERFDNQRAEIAGILKRTGLPPDELASRAAIKKESFRKVAAGYQKASDRMMQSLKNVELTVQTAQPHVKAVDQGMVIKEVKLRMVPVVSWAAAGVAQDYSDMTEQIDEMIETECRDENAFALIIEGDSMEPRFLAGDIVIFAPGSEARSGNFVAARLREGKGVLFKKFKRTGPEGGLILLESLNPHYKSKEYPTTAFHFIYPAVEMKARFGR